jgi:hypothetical protein
MHPFFSAVFLWRISSLRPGLRFAWTYCRMSCLLRCTIHEKQLSFETARGCKFERLLELLRASGEVHLNSVFRISVTYIGSKDSEQHAKHWKHRPGSILAVLT